MDDFKTILKNFGWLTSSEIINKLIGFFFVVLFIRNLGTETFGIYSYVTVFVLLFSILLNFGLPTVTTRDLAQDKKNLDLYLATISIIKIFISAIVAILVFIITELINKPKEVNILIYIALIWIIISSFEQLIHGVFRAYNVMKFEALLLSLNKIGWLIGLLVLIKYSLPLKDLFLFYIIISMITFIASLILIRKKVVKHKINLKFKKDLAIRLVKESWPLGIGMALVTIDYYFDTILLGIFRTNLEVGIYSGVYKILIVLVVGRRIFNYSIYPKMAEYYKKSKDKLKDLINKSERLSISVGLPLVIGGILLAGDILSFLYGPEFSSGITPFRILLIQTLMSYTNLLFTPYLHAVGRQKEYAKVVGIGTGTNVILNFALIPKFGMVGAAIATITSFITIFLQSYYKVKKDVDIKISKLFIKPIIACIPMALILILLPSIHVIFSILIGGAIYLTTLKIIGGLKRDYLRLIG